jgi:uncharacterized damage-inducible protein DinB
MSLQNMLRSMCTGMALVAVVAVPVARAEDMAAASGVKAEMLHWMGDAQSKLEELADVTPEAKYTWRPSKGVRSTGEVFLHVAAANFGIPSYWGTAPPEGFKFQGYETSMTKKADIQKALKDSFTHMMNALENASDEDLNKQAEVFGQTMTVRGGYMLILSHVHEHLGQSIAYARSNGIVPPWTARQNAAAAAKAKEAEEKKEH